MLRGTALTAVFAILGGCQAGQASRLPEGGKERKATARSSKVMIRPLARLCSSCVPGKERAPSRAQRVQQFLAMRAILSELISGKGPLTSAHGVCPMIDLGS